MEINYWAILVCGILSMVVGSLWYGPLFGKTWMRLSGVTAAHIEARKKMQKSAMPLYIIQFLLTLLQVFVLALFIGGLPQEWNVYGIAVFFWLGFVMPTIAGSAMWNNEPNKTKWSRFLIQAGYQLPMFLIFAFILGMWK